MVPMQSWGGPFEGDLNDTDYAPNTNSRNWSRPQALGLHPATIDSRVKEVIGCNGWNTVQAIPSPSGPTALFVGGRRFRGTCGRSRRPVPQWPLTAKFSVACEGPRTVTVP